MYYGQGNTIKSFAEVDSYSFVQQLSEKIKNEIEGKGKEYILRVDEEEFKKYFIDKYTVEPLVIDFPNEQIDQPTVKKEWVENPMWREKYQTDVYSFTIRYPFTGSSVLFKVRPSSWVMTSAEIYVNDSANTISFSFKLYKQDPTAFNQAKNDYHHRAFANLGNANKEAASWNNQLSGLVNSHFSSIKSKYEKENNFFTAINVKVNQDTKNF